MDDLAPALQALADATAELVYPGGVAGLVDDDLLTVTAAVEALGRRVDALRVHCAGELAERSRRELGLDRLSAKKGCRTPVELIARVARVAESTAARRIRLGSEVRVRTSLVGEDLPPRFESVADGLACGELGVDSAQVIVEALAPIKLRVDADEWMTAQRHLVADAVGASGPAFTPDQTRVQATVWQTALDRDGVELRAEEAMRHRGLTRLGTRDGLVRYRMELMPEVSGKLERALDACVSPKTAPKFLSDEDASELEATRADERTSGQKRHDAFAALVDAAARSAELPTIGGAAPTVLVRVDLDDLESGTGAGWIDGVDEPVSMQAVTQLACAGGVQRVLMSSAGRLISLGAPDRIFTPQQRRAIFVRDGGCVIPGCKVPGGWCEIHHVTEHRRGGPTHTDNGVSLCWFHHRTIETSGWSVDMRRGVPYVRPPGWIDPRGSWRPAGEGRSGRMKRSALMPAVTGAHESKLPASG
jgi:hypothetical protein